MAFERPAFRDLISETEADLDFRVLAGKARAPRRVTSALARVLAAGRHALYAYIAWGVRQYFVHLADEDGLADHALTWSVARKPAVAASGTVVFTGVAGGAVDAGAIVRAEDGRRWRVTTGGIVTAESVQVPVVCETVGSAGNAGAGTSVSLLSPAANVESQGEVGADGIAGGTDIEAASSWRARIAARIKTPPHGGNKADYLAWALEVPGVEQAWISKGELGAGTVVIRVWGDGAAPDAAVIAAAQSHIETQANVVGEPVVMAPVPVPLDVTIHGLDPATAEVQAAITASLADLLLREAAPGATIRLSHIREAISLAAGEVDHVLVAPAASVTHLAGQMAVLGAVTMEAGDA